MSLIHVHIGVYNMQKKACFDGIFRCPYNSFCSALCKFTTHTVWQITEHSATVVLILSGALASSNTNLEQTRGYRSSPLGALRPKVPPSGRHPLHTSGPPVGSCCKPPIVAPPSYEEATTKRYILNLPPYIRCGTGCCHHIRSSCDQV
jgi:hypothetical protein